MKGTRGGEERRMKKKLHKLSLTMRLSRSERHEAILLFCGTYL